MQVDGPAEERYSAVWAALRDSALAASPPSEEVSASLAEVEV